MLKSVVIAVLFVISLSLNAQEEEHIHTPAVHTDSIKKPRILREWTLSPDFSEEVNIPIDTVFSLSHRYRITDKYSPVNAYLGNYGLPLYQVNFFDRITDPDKFLYTAYYPFMYIPEKALFMNTQVPYTQLDWSFAGVRENSEQTFRIRHSQNVNRFLNFGIIYDIVFSLGQYNFQRAENKDFTFYSSYTGDRYKLYFSAGINNIKSYENGGIKDFNQIAKVTNMRQVITNLGGTNNALSTLKNRSILLVQRYTIGGAPAAKKDSTSKEKQGFFGLSGTFSHILTLETNKRTYSDQDPNTSFYDTMFVTQSPVFDSLYSRYIKNTVRFDFTTDETRKFQLGGGAGIRSEVFRYSQLVPTFNATGDTLFPGISVWNRSNNAVVGRLYNNIGDKFRWVATGDLYLTGYRSGDFDLNGVIDKSFDLKKGRASWTITGGMSNRQPSFWFQNWRSSHFQWDTNLKKEFRINVGTKFSFPARKMDLRFNYAIINNYTDFDTTAHPSQYSGALSVAAITVSKDLRLWKFHLASDVILQQSSAPRVLDLPFLALKSAGYFEHLFRFKSTGGRLNTQLGAEVLYTSAYHGYAYMPATGRFYRQETTLTGNYPYVNVFLNFKVKRTRVFLMFDHVNSGMMGYDFAMVPSYPMNVRMLRYGLSWTFYD
ncbi:MAG: putative porin [Methanosarcina sp.]